MKILKFNESKTNYTPTSLLDVIDEVDDLKTKMFQYYFEKEDIDLDEEYISERNVTTVNNNIVLWFDDEAEFNASYFIKDIDDLTNYINNPELYKNSKKYNI